VACHSCTSVILCINYIVYILVTGSDLQMHPLADADPLNFYDPRTDVLQFSCQEFYLLITANRH